jgi:hypothetical protein
MVELLWGALGAGIQDAMNGHEEGRGRGGAGGGEGRGGDEMAAGH